MKCPDCSDGVRVVAQSTVTDDEGDPVWEEEASCDFCGGAGVLPDMSDEARLRRMEDAMDAHRRFV